MRCDGSVVQAHDGGTVEVSRMGTDAAVLKRVAQKDAYAMLEVPGQMKGMHAVGASVGGTACRE